MLATPAIQPALTFPMRQAGGRVIGLLMVQAGGVGGWVASVNWNGVALTVGAIGLTLVGSFVKIRQVLRDDQKRWEAENRESLSHQLAEANTKATESNVKLTELMESVARERESLHALRNEDNKRHLEMIEQNMILQKELRETSGQLTETSHELAEANKYIVRLTAKVERLQLRQEVQGNRVVHAVKSIGERVIDNTKNIAAVADNVAQIASQSGEFPATTAPDPNLGTPEGETPENRHSQP